MSPAVLHRRRNPGRSRLRRRAPGHGRRVGRIPAALEPSSDRPPGERQRGVAERRASVGSRSSASWSSSVVVVAEQAGRAGEDRGHVALGQIVHQREEFVADSVAPEAGVVVRRIVRRTARPSARTAPRSPTGAAPGSARVGPGVIAPSPLAPEPRSSASSSVSAWSSAVWPVSASGPSASWRATRALASRFGPSTQRRCARRGTRCRAARRSSGAHASSSSADGSQAVIDVDGGDVAAGGDGEADERGRIGTARQPAHARACPAAGTCDRRSRSAIIGSVERTVRGRRTGAGASMRRARTSST